VSAITARTTPLLHIAAQKSHPSGHEGGAHGSKLGIGNYDVKS